MERKVDYGDFSEYKVRCLMAEFCRELTVGTVGWGVTFIAWLKLRNIAEHQGSFKLKKIGIEGGCHTCKTPRILSIDKDGAPETFVYCRECKRNTFHYYDADFELELMDEGI